MDTSSLNRAKKPARKGIFQTIRAGVQKATDTAKNSTVGRFMKGFWAELTNGKKPPPFVLFKGLAMLARAIVRRVVRTPGSIRRTLSARTKDPIGNDNRKAGQAQAVRPVVVSLRTPSVTRSLPAAGTLSRSFAGAASGAKGPVSAAPAAKVAARAPANTRPKL